MSDKDLTDVLSRLESTEKDRDALFSQLQEQVNDCINFNGSDLTDSILQESSKLLEEIGKGGR